jgi:Domain of unknown function (DUF4832)
VAALATAVPFGGETCNTADEAKPTPRTDCADILREGRRFGLTCLNDSDYRPLFHARWQELGCLARKKRSMGYRFELVTLRHSAAVAAGNRGRQSGRAGAGGTQQRLGTRL